MVIVIGLDSLYGGTLTLGGATTTSKLGTYIFEDKKFHKDRAKKLGITSVITGATTTTLTSYSETKRSLHKNATAYINSLDDSQLAALEVMLDNKQEKDYINLNVIEKQLTKKL